MKNKFLVFLLFVLILILIAIVLMRIDAEQALAVETAVPPTISADGIKAVKTCHPEPEPTVAVEDIVNVPYIENQVKPETAVAAVEVEAEPIASGTGRYAAIIPYINAADIDLLAAMVYQESNNQSFEGQQAVAEVALNRMLNPAFPDTVYGVLYQTYNGAWQFSTAPLLASTTPNQTNYDAVFAALYGPQVLDSTDVVFFSRSPENSRVADHIGAHWFCREYIW